VLRRFTLATLLLLVVAAPACAGPAVEALPVFLAQGEVGVYGVLVGGANEDRIQVTFTECPHPLVAERGAVSVLVAR